MGSNLSFSCVDTPTPAPEWLRHSEAERLSLLERVVASKPAAFREQVSVTQAKDDGQVIVKLKESLSAGERGTLLLDFEAFLKEAIDPGLVVWVEALGDKNSLRNLRGIEVKA